MTNYEITLEEVFDPRVYLELDVLIDVLQWRRRRILALRFGLDGERPHTLQEIADDFGLSRERIRQLLVAATANLQSAAAGSHCLLFADCWVMTLLYGLSAGGLKRAIAIVPFIDAPKRSCF
jgi:hypothetical protein